MPGSRQRRSAQAAALVIGGGLALSACGSGDEGESTGSGATAAVVEGETITVGEVQETSRDVADILRAQSQSSGQQPQELGPDTLLSVLVQVPTILEYADENDLAVPSEAEVEKQIGEVVSSPSQSTVDFVRANAAYSQLQPDQQQEVGQQFEDLDVSYSPRYAAITGESPNWLEQSEDELPLEMP